jgi:hypothetical protein
VHGSAQPKIEASPYESNLPRSKESQVENLQWCLPHPLVMPSDVRSLTDEREVCVCVCGTSKNVYTPVVLCFLCRAGVQSDSEAEEKGTCVADPCSSPQGARLRGAQHHESCSGQWRTWVHDACKVCALFWPPHAPPSPLWLPCSCGSGVLVVLVCACPSGPGGYDGCRGGE